MTPRHLLHCTLCKQSATPPQPLPPCVVVLVDVADLRGSVVVKGVVLLAQNHTAINSAEMLCDIIAEEIGLSG